MNQWNEQWMFQSLITHASGGLLARTHSPAQLVLFHLFFSNPPPGSFCLSSLPYKAKPVTFHLPPPLFPPMLALLYTDNLLYSLQSLCRISNQNTNLYFFPPQILSRILSSNSILILVPSSVLLYGMRYL